MEQSSTFEKGQADGLQQACHQSRSPHDLPNARLQMVREDHDWSFPPNRKDGRFQILNWLQARPHPNGWTHQIETEGELGILYSY